ncbi:TonB-dependent siderophore receptor [Maricaulis salignorans]|uniref:Iron complex outermembrane recepter protein n=1 Tax=Maricaulis salignorans TaxID=144026 RepID=A0A1G9TWJ7_9PROT|nr:TonB-dependent siderophore receptor [Maricaulis salignorans]SDM52140.1 iron complex outermembrane recepter protein [Maricaulis salignorans]
MNFRYLAFASALPFMFSGQAIGQSPADTPQDDGVDVIVVTATGLSQAFSSTKSDAPLIETPQSISLITREEMDIRGVHTVAEALSYSAGIQAEASGIDSRVDEVSVRGFGAGGFSSNNNFVDGLRLPTGGQWTRPAFDPFGLQQVEVLKGPSSVLYGQVAPGGIVNLVSKRPTDRPMGEIMLQTAGFTGLNHWQHQIAGDIGGPIAGAGDDFQYRLVGLYRDGDTQIDETANNRLYLSPSLNWDITPDTSLTLLAQYQRDEGGSTYQFLPATGTLYESNGRHIELDAYLGEPDWNQFDRTQYLAAGFLEHRFSNALRYSVNLRYTHIESLYRVVVLAGDTVTVCGGDPMCIPGQTINRRAVQGQGETDGWAVDNQLEYRFSTGAVEHTLLGGFDYFRTEWEHYRDLVAGAEVLPLYDIYNPQSRGSASFADNLNPQIYTEAVSEQSGIYIQDQIAAGNWRFALGARQDWAEDETYDLLNDTLRITEAEALTWQAGGVYLFDNGLAPYASYSESFLPSAGNYFDGTPFDPTTGQQYEVGLRYQPVGSNVFMTLSAYEITQQNVTTIDPDPAHLCGGRSCQVQTGEGVISGLEAEARATLPFGLAVIATATLTEAEITQTNTPAELGNALPGVPEAMASLFFDYRFEHGPLNGIGLGGGARYVGESYGNSTNTLVIPDYHLFDAMVRYDLGAARPDWNNLVLSINARNLANETNVATCGSVASCYYGSGRTVNLRLQYRW